MKKQIFMAALGMSAVVAAHGQGKIDFSNYFGDPSAPRITWSTDPGYAPPGDAGLGIGSEFHAALLYYVGTSALDIPFLSSQMTLFLGNTPAFGTSLNSGSGADGSQYAGWFEGGNIQIPGVNGGNYNFVSFEIEVYNSSSYYTANAGGISKIFQSPTTADSQTGAGYFTPGSWQNITVVTNIPEPSTLALTSLGGLVSLVVLRRKKT